MKKDVSDVQFYHQKRKPRSWTFFAYCEASARSSVKASATGTKEPWKCTNHDGTSHQAVFAPSANSVDSDHAAAKFGFKPLRYWTRWHLFYGHLVRFEDVVAEEDRAALAEGVQQGFELLLFWDLLHQHCGDPPCERLNLLNQNYFEFMLIGSLSTAEVDLWLMN